MVVHLLGSTILEIRPANKPPLLTMASLRLGLQMPLIHNLFIAPVILFRTPFRPVALQPYMRSKFLSLCVICIGVLAFLRSSRIAR